RDHAGHGLGHGALNLLVTGEHAIPPVRRHGARGSIASLHRSHHDGPLEAPVLRFVLQALHHRDRVIAQVLDHDVLGPVAGGETIGDRHPDRMVAKISVANTGYDDAHGLCPAIVYAAGTRVHLAGDDAGVRMDMR